MALQNIFARLFSRDDSEVSTYFKDLINSAQEILVEDILTVLWHCYYCELITEIRNGTQLVLNSLLLFLK